MRPALRVLVAALDDGDVRVRTAAVRALLSSAVHEPSAWFYPTFHHRADVRRAASRLPAPPSTGIWRLYQLADPTCHHRLFVDGLAPADVGMVVDGVRRGLVAPAVARQMVARLDWGRAIDELAGEGWWSALFGLFFGAGPGPDPDDPDDDDDETSQIFCDGLYAGLSVATQTSREAVLAALYRAADRAQRPWTTPCAVLALRFDPSFLVRRSVPLAFRQRAARATIGTPGRTTLSTTEAQRLLEQIAEEQLDADRAVAVLTIAPAGTLGHSALLNAFTADPDGWAPLIAADKVRARDLDHLHARLRGRLYLAIASLIARTPPERLGFVATLGRHRAPSLAALVRQRRGPASVPAPILARMVHRLDAAGVAQILRAWLADAWPGPAPDRDPFGGALLLALVAHHGEAVAAAARRLPTLRLQRLLDAFAWLGPADPKGLAALTAALADHPAPGVRHWTPPRAPAPDPLTWTQSARRTRPRPLPTEALLATFATHDPLPAIAAALEGPCRGLVAPLSACTHLAKAPPAVRLAAFVALLGCHDPPDRVHRLIDRLLSDRRLDLTALDRAAAAHWRGTLTLPALGHAWLAPHAVHARALTEALIADPRGPGAALAALTTLSRVSQRAQRGVSEVLDHYKRVDQRRYDAAMDPQMRALIAAGRPDEPAARIDRTIASVPLDQAIDNALLAGPHLVPEARIAARIEAVCREAPRSDGEADRRNEALARLLREGTDLEIGRVVARVLRHHPARRGCLARIANLFAWGVRMGERLCSRSFRFHLLNDGALGYTRIETADIHVSPLGALDGAPRGTDRVEGLILHEIGHHMYHAGHGRQAVWRKATEEGLADLFNLVADEHLERRLRRLDARFGDRLKRLVAHAFRHGDREFAPRQLLTALGPDAAAVLSRCRLTVGRGSCQVRVNSGEILRAMADRGDSFARFVRSLRMGLGHRDGDARVSAALALFGPHFKDLDMEGLLEVTRAVAALFGDQTSLCACFGGHEGNDRSGREAFGAQWGISDAEVEVEVRKILEPPEVRPDRPRPAPRKGRPTALLNVGRLAPIAPIPTFERLRRDPIAHRAIASQLRRPAAALRRHLERLGLATTPIGGCARGTRVDRSRLRGLVTVRDPRVLIHRRVDPASDVFVGVAIDCSGSMSGARLERARAFGVLIAEATLGLAGVDARFFGFTDHVLYDAGDAATAAVASLRSSGGNNDAAALAHVAQIARSSGRARHVLVMISDGLPTQCSVATLTELVRHLVAQGAVCAQVAVAPLKTRCFENFVRLDRGDLNTAATQFGALVGRLVARTLGASP